MNRTGEMPGYAKGGLVRPVKGGTYTGAFGDNRGGLPHAGRDIAVSIGNSVVAALDGVVLKSQQNAVKGRSGLGILLQHAGGITNTYYGHLSKLLVKVGETVKAGQRIALSGNTGRSTGPHLHFETWKDGKPVNPDQYLSGAAIPEGGGGGFSLNPLGPLLNLGKNMVKKFTGQFSDGNIMGQIAKSAVSKIVSGPVDWIKSQAAKIGDWVSDKWQGAKDFFTGGKSSVKKNMKAAAEAAGWGGEQWKALQTLVSHESGFNPKAQNPTSTAYGLFQFLDSTWGAYGFKKSSDPGVQTQAGFKYIQDRYGDPLGAWDFWSKHHWYAKGGLVPELHDQGGWLRPGTSLIENRTRKPEAILNPEQWDTAIKSIEVAHKVAEGGASVTYHYHAGDSGGSARDFFAEAAFQERKQGRVSAR